jgi:hypothetical protein
VPNHESSAQSPRSRKQNKKTKTKNKNKKYTFGKGLVVMKPYLTDTGSWQMTHFKIR